MAVSQSDMPEPFRGASRPIEVLDDAGHLVGVFLPISEEAPYGAPPKGYQPPISDEEIERRRQKYKSGRTWAEIKKHLEGRTS